MNLRVLVATLVAQEHEAGRHRRARHPGHGHRLAVEGQLFARTQRGHDAMQLFDVAEARGDQHGIARQPVDEARAARVQVVLESRGEGGVDRGDVVEDEVAAFFDGGV